MKAFAAAGRQARWTEWNLSATESPGHIKGYGSPTVLVRGRDIAGLAPDTTMAACRVYQDASGQIGGIPTVEQIAEALAADNAEAPGAPIHALPGWRNFLGTAPAIAAAFLPSLVCPACLPLYAGLVSAIGLGLVLDRDYLLLLTAALLTVAVGALALSAWKSRRYGPALLGLVASVVILAGKFSLNFDAATYVGIGGLLAATVWNVRPARCRSCDPESLTTVSVRQGGKHDDSKAKD
jgi:hypothetical protein